MKQFLLFTLIFILPALISCSCDYTTESVLECYAKTGYLPSGYDLKLWDLASCEESLLQKLFDMGECPTRDDVRGLHFDGIVNYVKFDTLGRAVFELFIHDFDVLSDKLVTPALSFQKRFYTQTDSEGRDGTNFWSYAHEQMYRMKTYVSPAVQNKSYNSLKIDYTVPGNNVLTTQPLIDEIRRIKGSDIFVGKMYFRVAGEPVFILWFSLEQR
ncbi:hypothetical protein M0813_13177 [Anaeramoeba flamelloides]|uniref:Lipoprotein n=1 Tax=Anaeramoeba flamelloides TaxID=1746091 RepID=A0ABQ8ZA57_9EUKA|nr:hypothetical protein M0813_13177 [Anaeramoeba flamelloides]